MDEADAGFDENAPATTPERPETLFHYTDAAGLRGIIWNRELWATDRRFLNDAQERQYALEGFIPKLRRVAPVEPEDSGEEFLKMLREDFAGYRAWVEEELRNRHFPVYVTCFSEPGDLLSAWRAYGTDHGYAVEFQADALEDALKETPLLDTGGLKRVTYGIGAADDLFSELLDDVSRDTNLAHMSMHAYYMAFRITAALAAVKHPAFAEEREWRLVVASEEHELADQIEFRASPIAVVPYIKIPFPLEAIRSVRVGPGRHVQARQQGVERLLETKESRARVYVSEVPLRT
ncbi:MAG: DUF2971 domain-containing protein [Actinomycetota bacterium]|nr:DUF2971 domain-containing protein [Actinomycetota bacterium]